MATSPHPDPGNPPGRSSKPTPWMEAPDTASRFTRWAFARQQGTGKMTRGVKILARILIIMVQEFFDTHITLRASALTFTIILSLIPLLAMSTAILKGLGSGDQLQLIAYRLIDQLDPPRHDHGPETVPPEENREQTPGIENDGETVPAIDLDNASINKNLRNAADTIFTYVDNTNFAALGAFGIVGLLITVILVFSTMEDAMNSIWHTRQGRSLFRKIMDYLALLVLLPISINVAIAGDAILESPKMMGYIETIIPSPWAVQMLFTLLPFIFITLTLMMMYLFFPHVRVKTMPALCGALFASIFWFLVQRAYIVMQIGVAKYNAIYGSFATVPLILIWIQLGWTFILLGAVLAYAIQNHRHYRPPGLTGKPQQALQRAFDILLVIYQNFEQARPTNLEELQEACPAESQADLMQTVDLLGEGGLLHTTGDNGSAGVMPSLPADKVRARDVVRLVLGHDKTVPTPGGTLAEKIITGAEQVAMRENFPGKYLQQAEPNQP